MPRKPPPLFPQEQRLLSDLGERLRLARKRRRLSNAVVAGRAVEPKPQQVSRHEQAGRYAGSLAE